MNNECKYKCQDNIKEGDIDDNTTSIISYFKSYR